MRGAYHPNPRTSREIQPFIIAPYGDMQDRMVFGPEAVVADQSAFLEWLYRDLIGRNYRSGFRLGWHAGFAVAARIRSMDLKETISNRRDALAVVGIMARKAAPAALCECLGVVGPIIASRAIGVGYPSELANEAALFEDLARFVAKTPRDHSWTVEALACRRECEGIPLFRIDTRYRLRKWLARRRAFGALVDARAPIALKYRLASELWLNSAEPDMTVLADIDEAGAGTHQLYLNSGFRPAGPFTSLSVRDVDLGRSALLEPG